MTSDHSDPDKSKNNYQVNSNKQENENMNLSVAHINVAGLQDKSVFPEFKEFVNYFQFVFFTETHTDNLDTISIPGFTVLAKHRSKMLKNSGGMDLAVSNSFDSDNIEILENNNELSFWFKVKNEHIHLDKDLIMEVAYFPPVGSEYKNDECFEILQNDIIKCYNPNESYLLLTGDLNSRTKNISEIAQTDTELLEFCNIDSNDVENNDNSAYVVTILEELGLPICRKSLDSQSNTFGHRLIELCKNNNLVILNGRVGEDQNIGNFTTTRNSVVDYIIMSANSLRYLSDFKVHKFDPLLSGIHCPISCHLLTKYKTNIYSNKEDNKGKYQTETNTKATNVCKWAKEKSEEVLNKISNDKVNQLNTYLESLDETMVNSDIINQIVENIKNIFIDAAESISNHRPKHNNDCQQKSSNKWFNNECVKSRRNYRKAKRHFYKLKNDNNKKALSDALKAYKKTIKIQQKNYNKFFCKKLREIKSKDPRTFWKILCNKIGT